MKPLLASLVLLLLALCRPSSSCTVTHDKIEEAIKALVSKEQQKTSAFLDILADFMNLQQAAAFLCGEVLDPGLKSLEPTYNNGLACTLKDSNLQAKIKTAMYGAATADEIKTKEKPIVDMLGITCNDPNTIVWCAGVQYHTTKLGGKAAGSCKEGALDSLKTAGPTLGKYFDYSELSQHKDEKALEAVFKRTGDAVDAIISWADGEMNNFFCDAINPAVETALGALYATDMQFFLAEFILMEIAFGPNYLKDGAAACDVPEFTAEVFGKCTCNENHHFFLFCVYKAIGQDFKDAGFLDCKEKKFVPDKKPAAVPNLLKGIKKGSSTAFSLLTVTLVAAAALFARH